MMLANYHKGGGILNAVKELRERAGMQQKELAILVGVARPTVSEWEHQKKDPSGDRLKKLSEIFSVDPGIILGYRPISYKGVEDDELAALREQIRRNPETRMLYDAIRKASPEHIRAATAMLKALEPEDDP